jgi:HEAT repeat protein
MQTKRTVGFTVGLFFAGVILFTAFKGLVSFADDNPTSSPAGSLNPLRTTVSSSQTSPSASHHFLALRSQAQGDDRLRALAAIYQLRECGSAGAIALAQLLAKPDLSMEYHFSIVNSLAAIGPDAVPPVLNLLKSDQDSTKTIAWQALQRLGPNAKSAVPTMLDLVANEEGPVDDRVAAVRQLGEIGDAAAAASYRQHEFAEKSNID